MPKSLSPISPSSSSSLKRHRASPRSNRSSPVSPGVEYSPSQSTAPGKFRRREANRLAAQRFRSRKKGYQDSLEERIRVLESEKEVLIRQLDEKLSHTRSTLPHLSPSNTPTHPQVDGADGQLPSREAPAELRIASLESANRRLQEDIRNLFDENEKLRDQLERMKLWGPSDGHHVDGEASQYPNHHSSSLHIDVDHQSRRQSIMDGHADGHSPRMDGNHPSRLTSSQMDGDHSRGGRTWADGHDPRKEVDGQHAFHNHDKSSSSRRDMADGHSQDHRNLPSFDRSMAYPTPSSSSFGSQFRPNTSESSTRTTQLPSLRLPPIRTALSVNAPTLRGFSGPLLERPPQMDGHR